MSQSKWYLGARADLSGIISEPSLQVELEENHVLALYDLPHETMDSIDNTDWDVLTAGTGLQESLLAL